MNRRTFLSTLAAIPLAGPAAAMAAGNCITQSPITIESVAGGARRGGWVAVVENVADLLDFPGILDMRPSQWFMHGGDGHFYCGTEEFHPVRGDRRCLIPSGKQYFYDVIGYGRRILSYQFSHPRPDGLGF